jgi:hypothetical protein
MARNISVLNTPPKPSQMLGERTAKLAALQAGISKMKLLADWGDDRQLNER